MIAGIAPDPAAFCEEILADGARRAEQIRQEARTQGEAFLAKARLDVETSRRVGEGAARKEAARRAEQLLAGLPVEIRRMRASRVEALLESIRLRAQGILSRRGILSREAMVSMAARALASMGGEAFVLGVAAGESAALGAGLAAEILRLAGRDGATLTVVEDPSIATPGFILRDIEGRQRWDGRLTARLDRLWPSLRVRIAIGSGLLGTQPCPP